MRLDVLLLAIIPFLLGWGIAHVAGNRVFLVVYFNHKLQNIIDSSLIQILKLMSLDRRKNMHQRYVDTYSKNTILNSLIKHKLQNEMAVVKENVGHIVKKQQQTPKKEQQPKIRRQKSFSINPHKIQESLSYNPMSKLIKATESFVSQRQNETYLIPHQILNEVNSARLQPEAIKTKIKQNDKYEYESLKRVEDFKNLTESVKDKTIKEFSEDVWLPSQPEVSNLIENKRQQIQELSYTKKSIREFITTQENKFGHKLLGESYSKKQLSSPPLLIRRPSTEQSAYKTISYEPSRYHKTDYKSLEGWFERAIETIGQETKLKVEERINIYYSIYLSGWKQFTRLTYIESAEKGLLMEKFLFSFLRLFRGILGEEHTMTKSYYLDNELELKEINRMQKDRMQKLQNKYRQISEEVSQLKERNYKLSLGFLSYEKINKELVTELEQITAKKNQSQKSIKSIGNAYFKALESLYEKGSIELDDSQGDGYKSYFMITKENKPLILGRFQNNQFSDIMAEEEQKLLSAHNLYAKKIKKIDNDLNDYWSKKEDDLELKLLVNSTLINIRFRDVAVGPDEQTLAEAMTQFPESGENPFEAMLNQQKTELTEKFEEEKKIYELKVKNLEHSIMKWKVNTNQLQEKVKNLQQVITKSVEEKSLLKVKTDEAIKNLQLMNEEKLKLSERIKEKETLISQLEATIEQANSRIASLSDQKSKFNKILQTERQNNLMLVKNNLELKEKVEGCVQKYEDLVRRVKNVSPWLQKLMGEVDAVKSGEDSREINLGLCQTVSGKIEQYLGQYVERDSTLFMTKLQ